MGLGVGPKTILEETEIGNTTPHPFTCDMRATIVYITDMALARMIILIPDVRYGLVNVGFVQDVGFSRMAPFW